MMENQLETMRESISALKSKKPKKDKSGKPGKASSMTGKPSKPKTMNGGPSKSSRPSVPGAMNGSGKKSSSKKKRSDEHRTLSFDEKKELAQKIGSLEEGKVEKVIQIIHEAMPHTQEVRVLFHPLRNRVRSTRHVLLTPFVFVSGPERYRD
jgi:hypothetical protein